jgi:hypothetical protein
VTVGGQLRRGAGGASSGSRKEAIRSSPRRILQVRERLLILPIIGSLDSARARQLTEQLLGAIRPTGRASSSSTSPAWPRSTSPSRTTSSRRWRRRG